MTYKELFHTLYLKAGYDLSYAYWGLNLPVSACEPALRWVSQLRPQSSVAVVGDYDADGILSTVAAVRTLEAMGFKPTWFLPHRERDGYGFKPAFFEKQGLGQFDSLLILDSGTTQMEWINTLSMPVLVVDHHELLPGQQTEPRLFNPHLYPETADMSTCTAALWYHLAQILVPNLAAELRVLLLLCASTATVTDVCTLNPENRYLVRKGGEAWFTMPKHPLLVGFRQLYRHIEAQGALDYRQLGWRIGPLLNAAGRMADAAQAVALLLETDTTKAEAKCRSLAELNTQRQQVTQEAVNQAQECLKEPLPPVILVQGQWPLGVNGLIAGKLCEQFRRPALAMSFCETRQMWEGSGRVPATEGLGEALFEGLRAAQTLGLLQKFGGHHQAFGFGTTQPDVFKTYLAASSHIPDTLLAQARASSAPPVVFPITSEDFNPSIIHAQKALEPFGPGCPEPVYALHAPYGLATVVEVNKGYRATFSHPQLKPITAFVPTSALHTLLRGAPYHLRLSVHERWGMQASLLSN